MICYSIGTAILLKDENIILLSSLMAKIHGLSPSCMPAGICIALTLLGGEYLS